MSENKNSKAKIAANNRYNAKTYDRINIAIPKGRKDEIKEIAESQGKTINKFIIEAIDLLISKYKTPEEPSELNASEDQAE